MAKPIQKSYVITQGFNQRYPDSVIKQFPNISPFHDGIDISVETGTPVHAVDSGVVRVADIVNDANGLGVVINHGNGSETIYWHLGSVLVRAGQSVLADQVIGYVDTTGYATGPHLHFGMRLNGVLVDPSGWLDGAVTVAWPKPPVFKVGDHVTSKVSTLHIRQGSGLSFAVTGDMHIGTEGVVKGGPRQADGYSWYDLDFTSFGGGTGWVAGDFLKSYEPAPLPPAPIPPAPAPVPVEIPAQAPVTPEVPPPQVVEAPVVPVEAPELPQGTSTPTPSSEEVSSLFDKLISFVKSPEFVGTIKITAYNILSFSLDSIVASLKPEVFGGVPLQYRVLAYNVVLYVINKLRDRIK